MKYDIVYSYCCKWEIFLETFLLSKIKSTYMYIPSGSTEENNVN